MPNSKSVNHAYSTEVAIYCKSVDAAMIFYHLQYWIRVNYENNRNYQDGKFWTYQTYEQLAQKFIHLSVQQIRRHIKKLVSKGFLKISNFNKKKFDKTNWYTLTDEYYNKFIEKTKEKVKDIKRNLQEKIETMKVNIEYNLTKVKRVIKKIFTSVDFDRSSVDFDKPIPDNKTTYISKKEKKQKKAALSEPSPTALELSSLLYESIKEIRPNFKEPNLKSWAKDVDLMIRIDKRQPQEIKDTINFLKTNFFWRKNVISTAKLRKNFDSIGMAMLPDPQKVKIKTQEIDVEKIEARKHWARSEISKNWSNFKREEKPRAQVEFVEFGRERLYYKDLKFDELFKHNMRKWLF